MRPTSTRAEDLRRKNTCNPPITESHLLGDKGSTCKTGSPTRPEAFLAKGGERGPTLAKRLMGSLPDERDTFPTHAKARGKLKILAGANHNVWGKDFYLKGRGANFEEGKVSAAWGAQFRSDTFFFWLTE